MDKTVNIHFDTLLNIYGPEMRNVHKAILDNVVNNPYFHCSNLYVSEMWYLFNKKFQ